MWALVASLVPLAAAVSSGGGPNPWLDTCPSMLYDVLACKVSGVRTWLAPPPSHVPGWVKTPRSRAPPTAVLLPHPLRVAAR